MTTIAVPLADDRLADLQARAELAGQTPEEFLARRVVEWLDEPADDFRRAAEHVLAKNAELYRRLA